VKLGEQGALTAVILWGIAAAGGAVIDHFAVGARERRLHIAAFMPLIKKTVASFFLVFSILVVLESLGFEVKTFLAGLGIGGLAFALAAQDTIANLFGSFVVVMDQPFYVGEYIRIVSVHEGTVEEIGLRSTRLRTAQRTQIVIPNKTVANEVITNFTRMPQRRVDTTLSVAYGNSPEAHRAGAGRHTLAPRRRPRHPQGPDRRQPRGLQRDGDQGADCLLHIRPGLGVAHGGEGEGQPGHPARVCRQGCDSPVPRPGDPHGAGCPQAGLSAQSSVWR
jgi:hypothetical protein